MARVARVKAQGKEGFYFITCRAAGLESECPFDVKPFRRKLLGMIQRYSSAYFCKVYALTIMGNHWHGVFSFEAPREVDREELRRRAEILYPDGPLHDRLSQWTTQEWESFRDRLFDLSELMRNIQGSYALWYNKRTHHRGHLWGERFHSSLLLSHGSLLLAMIYTELNSIRAGLVLRPELYEYATLFLREAGLDGWLEPLESLLGGNPREALREYKASVYHLGSGPQAEGKRAISDQIFEAARNEGFSSSGALLKRLGFLSKGVVLGSREAVQEVVDLYRAKGIYTRRRNPIPQLGGALYTLTEERNPSEKAGGKRGKSQA